MLHASKQTGVPYNTVKHAVATGKVPAWKVGRITRVKVEDVAALIKPVAGGAA